MLHKDVQVDRPERWDLPLDESMSAAAVDRILQVAPFAQMDAERFPHNCSLRGLLLNDTRIVPFAAGDIVVREAEYGNSAFLILKGSVRVTLDSLPDELLGREKPPTNRFWSTLRRMLFRSRIPEYRRDVVNLSNDLGTRQHDDRTRVFLQDVPGILDKYRTLRMTAGEFFGELAALSRTPRSATVLADADTELLEIRWQGLRDLMRYDTALRNHIHHLYRRNSLASHLRQTQLLAQWDDAALAKLVAQTQFETYGDFEWQYPYRALADATANQRIAAEPVIAEEGSAADGLLLIRNGFARLSQRYGNGHRTCSYLGKGQTFGLAEIYHQSRTGRPAPLQYSLRAVGYVDILRIPLPLVERHVLPALSEAQRSDLQARYQQGESARQCGTTALEPTCGESDNATVGRTEAHPSVSGLETGMLEFVVDNRLMNGSQAMVIDLDRCTRCDDCVRACSDTHDNNPRFVRQGPVLDGKMFASACMHCVDPVCMIGCPTGAIHRDLTSGTVSIHDGACIGCGTCAHSCPYNAIRMVDIRDRRGRIVLDRTARLPITKATKCDLCEGLLGGPACQRACPHDALVRIDLRQPHELKEWLAR